MNDSKLFDEQDIAVIGIGLRFPGAKGPEQFWDNLKSGYESVEFYSDEVLLEAGVSKANLRNPHYVKAGAPLQGMEDFDPEFFGFSPKEGGILDPQHRHFYECAWEAIEDSGHVPEKFDGQIGVYAGCGMGAYFAFNLVTNPELVNSVGMFLLRHTGNDKDFLSSRVSYSFNLRGPSVNVQTACSTSLVATHLACQSLISGECDMALAGGSTIELPHRVGYLYKEGEILSPDGHCRAFDAQSKGTIFGSGTGVVVLRRMVDAVENGDNIYAVIKGTAINNDGDSKVGYLAPSVDGQAAAITEALAVSDVDADTLDYVECHGTGTPMGDPIEVAALTQAFRETSERNTFCGIGSVKTNIGHLDTAAGVASLAKVCLSLHHKKIPPSLNYSTPNPTIDFSNSPFYVNNKLKDWPERDTPLRAGVNSLGVGGTNAFAIIEGFHEAKQSIPSARAQSILAISGKSRKALDGQCEKLARYLELNPDTNLADLSYSLLETRQRFDHRRVISCASVKEASELLVSPDPLRVATYNTSSDRAPVVFLFPGGGAQYVGMGAGLYKDEPVYREFIDLGIRLFRERTEIDLTPFLTASPDLSEQAEGLLETPSIQLPAIFIVEYALTRLWAAFGITPDSLIGHSMGENTAACVAGVMSYEDALGLVTLRGKLMDSVPAGGMLSVEMPADQLRVRMGSELDLASNNSPILSVVSGSNTALDALSASLVKDDVEHQRIKINIAAHSRLLEGIMRPFKDYLDSISLNPPEIPIVSNRTGIWMTDEEATSADYWVEHLRHTVLFSEGIESLLKDSERAYIETGPGNILTSLVRQNNSAIPQRTFSSLRHPSAEINDSAHFVSALGKLWLTGYTLESERIWSGETRVRLRLPTYAFQHNRYWIDAGNETASTSFEFGNLEKNEDLSKWFYKPAWVQQGLLPSVTEERETWLCFLDEEGVGDSVCDQISAQGHRVIMVRAGDAYYRISDSEYYLSPELGAEGYESLASDLLASGNLPSRILHLWLFTGEESFRPGSSFFHRNQEHGFYSLFFLATALGNADMLSNSGEWVIVTNGMQRVASEPLPYPDKSTVLGPCNVIPREFPGISCRVIDVAGPETAGRKKRKSAKAPKTQQVAATLILNEIRGAASDPEKGCTIAAYRDSVRWEQYYHLVEPDQLDLSPEQSFKDKGVYLITGGLGGIGFTIARHLASSYNANLVVVNRTPLPDRSEWGDWLRKHSYLDRISAAIRNVIELEKLGANVLAMDGDVTNVSRMNDIIDTTRNQLGGIDGVFHGAGVVRDSLIQAKTQAEIEEVFAPKVYGTMVLGEALSGENLDFFLLFSSTSTVIAPMGQVDYVAANAFLNAYAQASRYDSANAVTAINWGVWNEIGMAAKAAAEMGIAATSASDSEELLDTRSSLFDKKSSLATQGGSTHTVYAHLSPSEHWMLDQHRTSEGEAVLPGTGFFELALRALGEFETSESVVFEDTFFFVPLAVSDNESRRIRIRLKTNQRGYQFQLHSETPSEISDSGWVLHAESNIVLKPGSQPEDVDIRGLCEKYHHLTPDAAAEPIQTGQGYNMRFGKRWEVLRQEEYLDDSALGYLTTGDNSEDHSERLSLNPALLDIATGFAMPLIEGYLPGDPDTCLWVPVSYSRLRVHGSLPGRIFSQVKSREGNSIANDFASFDVTIANETGKVLVEVSALTIRKMSGGFHLDTVGSSPAAHTEALSGSASQQENRQLSASEQVFQHNLTQGILPSEGIQAIQGVLGLIGEPQIIVTSLPLDGLESEAESVSKLSLDSDSARFSRPELDSEYIEARDDVEKTLVNIWEELLGVDQIGINDSFFDLGGHSLVAVRLFAKLKQAYSVDYPISVLFETPTIAQCAEKIKLETGIDGSDEASSSKSERPETRFTHLVPMHTGSADSNKPFFLVAGMFGNVLNLRHLAQLVGSDRPFYGLQARGLYGDQEPHTTFEEMARDYIREMRTIQPAGPYLIGGFSGGGITAYEIARQLMIAGDAVGPIVMLDTPLPQSPPLSSVDRMSIHLQRLKSRGPAYLTEWAKNRYKWELEKFQNRLSGSEVNDVNPFDFKSTEIEIAFRTALDRYDLQPLETEIHLFRPRLDQSYTLPGGRKASKERTVVLYDNGWSDFVTSVHVYEVPGDHDGMVLEPNVRVLAEKLRSVLK